MQTDSHISVISPDRYYGYSRHTEMTFCNYESPCQTTRNPMLAAEMQGPYIGLCVCVCLNVDFCAVRFSEVWTASQNTSYYWWPSCMAPFVALDVFNTISRPLMWMQRYQS